MVHIHAEGPAFFAWLPKMFGKRVVVTVHGIDWQREKWQSGLGSKFIHQGEKNAAKYADEVIVLSKDVQKYFLETYGRAYLAANTCDFCFLLQYLFDMPMRVDVVTDDDDQRIDTILDVDNQRQSLKELAEKYTSIRRKDYLEWRIRLEHEMIKAEEK